MVYYELQQSIYENKVRRNFNVSDVCKEVVLMSEEFGELCDAYLTENNNEIVDAIGDLVVYCLGLSAMFKWNADEVINLNIESPISLENTHAKGMTRTSPPISCGPKNIAETTSLS